MKAIWKWPLEPFTVLDIPAGGHVLTVQPQGDQLVLWALVDQNAVTNPRHFRVYGTGEELPDNPGDYVATAQVGSMVWHVFEVSAETEADSEY